MRGLEEILLHHAFFEGLNKDYISLIARCGKNQVFKPGEMIGREGDSADNFYIVRDGKIAIQIFSPGRGPLTIQTLGKDEIVGWSWLFPPYKWSFDIMAVETTRTIALDGKCLRKKCEENHDLGFLLMKKFSAVMVRRLQAARMQILDIYKESPA